jgi:hypothetical protein
MCTQVRQNLDPLAFPLRSPGRASLDKGDGLRLKALILLDFPRVCSRLFTLIHAITGPRYRN